MAMKMVPRSRRGWNVVSLFVVGCGVANSCLSADDPGTRAVVDWNVIAVRTVQTGEPLLRESRNAAMVQIAVFDALDAITPRYQPYFLRVPSQPEASPVAAVATAAHDALVALYPAQQAVLDSDFTAALRGLPDDPAKDAGIALGRQAAQAVLRGRANDHSADTVDYTAGANPGAWRPTPGDGIAPSLAAQGPDLVPAFGPGWGLVTPFVLDNGAQFRPGPPPALSSDIYARDFAEIVAIGSANSTTRTPEQTQIALFWWATAVVLWNQPVQQLVIAQGFDAIKAAHAFALLNVMIADAGIACWDAKYAYNQWRPITGIRNADSDGNPATTPDPAWAPLMWSPPFPDYPSGHSVVGAAAARALAHSFGPRPGEFSMTGAGGVVHRYEAFDDIVREVIDARVWGGAHWRSSDTLGVDFGNRIADYVILRRGS